MKRVEGKVALVTGASLEMGRAIALLLAREGATVALVGMKDEEGRDVIDKIEESGGTAKFWQLDLSNEDEIIDIFADVGRKFGKIDILVNDAAISGVDNPTHKMIYCANYVMPYMKKAGGGSIINISSNYGLLGVSDIPPYHASIDEVRQVTKEDALLYAKDSIRVNSVHSGFIWTSLAEELGRRSPEGVEAFRKKLDSLQPIGHVGMPEDIANGVLYLASDESKFVTGSELVIDGGYSVQSIKG